jgi:hypothetical protein
MISAPLTNPPPKADFWTLTLSSVKDAVHLYFEPLSTGLLQLKIWLFFFCAQWLATLIQLQKSRAWAAVGWR